jgi:hypothetical protein
MSTTNTLEVKLRALANDAEHPPVSPDCKYCMGLLRAAAALALEEAATRVSRLGGVMAWTGPATAAADELRALAAEVRRGE